MLKIGDGSFVLVGYSIPIDTGIENIYVVKTMPETLPETPGTPVWALSPNPPSGLNFPIPLKLVPIQAAANVDINNDGKIDLVLGKPLAVVVSLLDHLPQSGTVTVTVTFEQKTYSLTYSVSDISPTGVVGFSPIVPESVGDKDLTGFYQINSGTPIALITTSVSVKQTNDLSLFYSYLYRTEYGEESQTAYNEMTSNSLAFLTSTYPIKNTLANTDFNGISGAEKGTKRDPYAGMVADAMAVGLQAQLQMGGSARGIAIGPNSGSMDYFTYHGFPGAAGISFGPGCNGVIVLDGYYSAVAHEVGHTYGLYYGEPEEYLVYPPNGQTASGVLPSSSEWRTGYDFMGLTTYKSTSLNWVTADNTFEYLFNQLKTIPNDPEIVLVNGIIHRDGSVEFPLDWYHLQQGTPDVLGDGEYSLVFKDVAGTELSIPSFDASFSVQIDPAVGEGGVLPNLDDFGTISTDFAAFSFAVVYPEDTAYIEIVDEAQPEQPLATISAQDIVQYDLTGTMGANGWYTSDVDITIVAPDTAAGIKELHYVVDGTETIINGNTASFTISSEGSHSLDYWVVENNDEIALFNSHTIRIDKTPPALSESLLGEQDNNGLYTSNVEVTLDALDHCSGVASIFYSLDRTSWTEYHTAFTLSKPGITTIYYYSIDNAGNTVTAKTINIDIDSVLVTIASSPSGFGFVKVDGEIMATPKTFSWYIGETHILEALSSVAGSSGTKYIYTGWSNGETQVQTFTVTASAVITANFKTQYYLSVKTSQIDLNPQPAITLKSGYTSGDGFYDAGSQVTLTAEAVNGYSFNYWTTIGINYGIGVNNVLLTLNGPFAATAYYVPFTLTGFFSDSDSTPLSSFDCVFTPDKGTAYKMSATNPGTFCYNLKITNNGASDTFPITVTIPSDFILRPLSTGTNPIQINNQPASYQISGNGNGQLTLSVTIGAGQTKTLTLYLYYALKFQYTSNQPYDVNSQLTFHKPYSFATTVSGAISTAPTVVATGNKVTAIGGFLTDVNGASKGGLTVNAYNSKGNIIASDTTTGDGFYFIMINPGGYTLRAFDSLGAQCADLGKVMVSKDQYASVDYTQLSPQTP